MRLGYLRPMSCYLASTISAMYKRTWDEAFRCVPILLPLYCHSSSCPIVPHQTSKPHNCATFATFATLGATPTRAGNHYASSTNLGHTQQEIKSSLWGRILRNEPGIIKDLIKPDLVDSNLVAAIEQALGENAELKATCDHLFDNSFLEEEMYTPMVSTSVGYCGELS